MTASVALSDPSASLWSALTRDLAMTPEAPASSPVRSSEVQLGVGEALALRQVDLVAPAELAALAEPLVKLYAGELSSGDHLRLPQRTALDGPALMSAVRRVLATETGPTIGDKDAIVKEERMRRVLKALEYATAQIQQKAAQTSPNAL
ncbi:MAG: hypothetical protein U1E65_27375 [Myxococcota bacterium]